ncbi:MAG: hypothetical protein ACO24P_00085 [Candidatus Nanopelagicaceae bacterium]
MHRHHIIPRYRGGSDDPSNIIEVTIPQHALWHFCNWQLWRDERDYCAWKGLAGLMSKKEILGMLSKSGKTKAIKPKVASLMIASDTTMQCIKCGSISNLVGSESLGHSVRRMRVCPKCGHKFLTYEIPQTEIVEAEEFVRSGHAR